MIRLVRRRRSVCLVIGLVMLALAGASGAALAGQPEIFTGPVKGVAVSGYDPVAYFADHKPVKGKPELSWQWKGVTWRFATAAHRDAFQAAPEKYAPQYGGYCAYAVAQGATASAVPQAWSIVDGKLYLNYSLGVKRQWEKDIPGYIAKADRAWPKVLDR